MKPERLDHCCLLSVNKWCVYWDMFYCYSRNPNALWRNQSHKTSTESRGYFDRDRVAFWLLTLNKARRQTVFVCGFGEINRQDEMSRPCIFTSDFYSVSDVLKLKFQNQMHRGMEKKQQKRRATSWLYIYRNNFLHSVIRPEQQPFQKKSVWLLFFFFSFSLFLFQTLSKQAMRQLGLRPRMDTMFV